MAAATTRSHRQTTKGYRDHQPPMQCGTSRPLALYPVRGLKDEESTVFHHVVQNKLPPLIVDAKKKKTAK